MLAEMPNCVECLCDLMKTSVMLMMNESAVNLF
jgi:hypothetical protein